MLLAAVEILGNEEPAGNHLAISAGATLNKLSDADLAALITHGGPALGRSPEMPPYGDTLTKSDIQALVAYIRAVADPPYHTSGVVYAQK